MTAMRGPPTFDNDAALGVHQGEKLEKRVGHVAGLRVVAPRRVWVLMTKAGRLALSKLESRLRTEPCLRSSARVLA